jgi:formate--tetrahydrofolate ligase
MTNLEIAQAAKLSPIGGIAETCGLSASDYEQLGNFKAKLTYEGMERLRSLQRGKLIIATAIL